MVSHNDNNHYPDTSTRVKPTDKGLFYNFNSFIPISNKRKQMEISTYTQANGNKHTNKQTHTHKQMEISTYTQANGNKHTNKQTHIHKQTRKQSHMHSRKQTQRHTFQHTNKRTGAYFNTQT